MTVVRPFGMYFPPEGRHRDGVVTNHPLQQQHDHHSSPTRAIARCFLPAHNSLSYYIFVGTSRVQGEMGAGTNLSKLKAIADHEIASISQHAANQRQKVVSELVGAVANIV